MQQRLLTITSLLELVFPSAPALRAQETHTFTANVGAGFTTPLGNTGNKLDMGWNIQGGVGMSSVPRLGANLDFGYASMGITHSALTN